MTVPTLRCSVLPVRSNAPDARLVVLGPSLGTTSALWDTIAASLSATYRVLRFDLPGHGFSPATREPFTVEELSDGVLAMIDSVGGGSFSYAGDSMGGAIGLTIALRHPERVLSVAAFCAPAVFGTPDGWRSRATQVRSSGTASVVGMSAERWFAPDYLARDPGPGAASLDRLLGIDDESYALCCEALAEFDLTASASAISVATVCVAGEFDVATPAADVEALSGLIPSSEYELIAGAGHLPVMERPVESEAIIRAHLPTGAAAPPSTRSRPDDAREAGMTVRREVLGDAHVDAANARITPETADFQDFITRYAWGEIWTRPGLTRRERSFLTLASLVTGGHENEIGMHVRAALTNGLTRAEISEAILHTAIYAGVPAANSAFAIARSVFEDLDAPAPEQSAPEQSTAGELAHG
jgi:3-oxoadipate enol-lactonase/4-carboxymuconolactone decarboxylase